MNRFVISLVIFLASSAFLQVKAQVKHYALDVHDFTELKVIDGVNVEYHISADSAGWARFDCTPEMAPHMLFTNNKNALKIQVDFENIPTGQLPTLHVMSASLLKVENSGDSTVVVHGLKNINTFNAKLIGNGTLIVKNVAADFVNAAISTGAGHLFISGQAQRVKLQNIGTGPLEANGLVCKVAKCVLLGTGPIDCNVTEELKIIGAGSGAVYYSGNPKKVINRTIGVKANPVE